MTQAPLESPSQGNGTSGGLTLRQEGTTGAGKSRVWWASNGVVRAATYRAASGATARRQVRVQRPHRPAGNRDPLWMGAFSPTARQALVLHGRCRLRRGHRPTAPARPERVPHRGRGGEGAARPAHVDRPRDVCPDDTDDTDDANGLRRRVVGRDMAGWDRGVPSGTVRRRRRFASTSRGSCTFCTIRDHVVRVINATDGRQVGQLEIDSEGAVTNCCFRRPGRSGPVRHRFYSWHRPRLEGSVARGPAAHIVDTASARRAHRVAETRI